MSIGVEACGPMRLTGLWLGEVTYSVCLAYSLLTCLAAPTRALKTMQESVQDPYH
jgi:hypothetical protein